MIGEGTVGSAGRRADVTHARSSVASAEHDPEPGAQNIIAERRPAHGLVIRSYVLSGQDYFRYFCPVATRLPPAHEVRFGKSVRGTDPSPSRRIAIHCRERSAAAILFRPPSPESPQRVGIAQVKKREAGAEHWPGGEEENVRAFEWMQVLAKGRER